MLDLQMNNAQKLSKGEEVLAVYPDTTSFYSATVTQVPSEGQIIHIQTSYTIVYFVCRDLSMHRRRGEQQAQLGSKYRCSFTTMQMNSARPRSEQ